MSWPGSPGRNHGTKCVPASGCWGSPSLRRRSTESSCAAARPARRRRAGCGTALCRRLRRSWGSRPCCRLWGPRKTETPRWPWTRWSPLTQCWAPRVTTGLVDPRPTAGTARGGGGVITQPPGSYLRLPLTPVSSPAALWPRQPLLLRPFLSAAPTGI